MVKGLGGTDDIDGSLSKRQSNVNSRASKDSRGINTSKVAQNTQVKLNINENTQSSV